MGIKMGKYQNEYYDISDMNGDSPMSKHKDGDETEIFIADGIEALKRDFRKEEAERDAYLARRGTGWVTEEDEISKAVSGSHYNDVVPGFQYMQMMQHMLEGKDGVEAHLLGQVYKYLMRAGKKDDVEQEYRKARWYLNCLVKYMQTGEIDPNNND